ncbi:MAG: TonB-dependent receptor, partial [Gemmatimonadota bacterium]|nr:TonB-dependent receptor [Gemmatimonadota bacterium]
VPAAVSVVHREDVDEQSAFATDLGKILAQTVPGLAPSTGTASNFGQTLRGRDLHVLVDGVPLSTPLRDGKRSLKSIDPAAIERIEVVRGANAAYGFGATGGIVNVVTRDPGVGDTENRTSVRVAASTTHPDGSLDARASHHLSGGSGTVRYSAGVALENTGRVYDADGDLAPLDPLGQGGLAEARGINLFGTLLWNVDEDRDLSFTVDRYDFQQEDLEFVTVPGVPGQEKATAEPGDSPSDDVGNESTVASVRFRDGDVAGSAVEAHGYFSDHRARFPFTSFFDSQSTIESEKWGGRLTIQTPLPVLVEGAALTWGVDLLWDETSQPLDDGRFFVPPMQQSSVGPYAQLRLPLGERVIASGGVRREEIWLDVDDFTTIEEVGGVAVEGGSLRYDATVFNAGATVGVLEGLDLFGGFSQGFSVSDVGRELRGTEIPSVEVLSPEPQKVDQWELGLRGADATYRWSLVGFRTESELGVTFGPDLRIARAPEETRGVEASLDVVPAEDWMAGGTFAWVEGERDADDDGEIDDPLGPSRIPPTKWTGYLENATLPGWTNRLQVLYSGSSDDFPESEGFGQGEVDAFTLVDLSSKVDLGPGALTLAVTNLLNELWFPPASQWYNLPGSYAAGPGRSVSASYEISW